MNELARSPWMVSLGMILGLIGGRVEARIVALDIDLPLDRVGTGRGFQVGDHHHARIFYDDARIDARTHRVRVLHMQHLLGSVGGIPARLDAVAMPMTDAWLDLSEQPYRYHYRSAVVEGGEAVLVDFDDRTQRMSIRLQSDQAVILAAPYRIDPRPVSGLDIQALFRRPPAYLMLAMDVAIDQVAPGEQAQVGSHDQLRVVFDASEIDAVSGHVPLRNMQHLIGGKYLPARADPIFMPVTDAWLDLRSEPYALHFKASVVHGKPILIEADEHTRRLTIHPQEQPGEVLISGDYQIDSRPISGPEADAAAAPENAAPTAAKSTP
jgi:hypothetical protein